MVEFTIEDLYEKSCESLARLASFLQVHFPNEGMENELTPDIALRVIETLKSKNETNGVEISSLLRELKNRDKALATHGVVVNPNADVPLATDYLDKK
jgi:hypothetical protein